ncbi:hypothetical protein ColLi_00219 [Colletotrichum liriopes]|uniref:Uncharacterized protein n=1 Tax=Colletotrichum liriopes TaxID=708192 RepID=A0AA37LM20_9PEZI|nr:hypothetical protein ColLi_00219 [Colletotrichum liriopes]
MHPTFRRLLIFAFFFFTATAAASSTERPPFKCPTYIDTVVPSGQTDWYGRREPGDPFLNSMSEVHNTLTNCSSIKSLKLRVTSLGCSEHPDRYTFPFSQPSGSRYPSTLESLDLEGYAFNDRPWDEVRNLNRWGNTLTRYADWVYEGKAWAWVKGLRMSQEQKNMTNLDLWLEAMDFSQIKHLAIRGGQTPNITTLVPHLKSLDSFSTYGSWAKELIAFLPQNSLKHLSWKNSGQTGASVEPFIRQHAESLTSLDWHEPESTIRQRKVMSPAQLTALGVMLPNLKSLTIDVNQNGTWPVDHLEAIATKFPNLENATIFFEMASECRRQLDNEKLGARKLHEMMMMEDQSDCSKGTNSHAQPTLGIYGAGVPFEFLVKKNGGGRLKKVNFYAGGWERGWDGALTLYEDWLDDQRAFVACEVIEGDGSAIEGVGGGVKVEKGDQLLICQNNWQKRHKVLSEVRKRRTQWEHDRYEEANEEIMRRAWRMDL